VGSLTEFLLNVLEFVGVVGALLTLLVLFVSALRALWRVRGEAILILPFRGSEHSEYVAGVLAPRLVAVENEWIELSSKVAALEKSLKGGKSEAVTGPATRTLSDALAWFDGESEKWTLRAPDGEGAGAPKEVVAEEPLDSDMVRSLSLGGVGFSAGAILTLLYKLRAAVARERVAGTLYEFGSTARLDGAFRKAGVTQKVTCVRQLETGDDLFDAIDDFAFQLLKQRLAIAASAGDFGTEAKTWNGYRSFLAAHDSHLRFLLTGRAFDREDAIEGYEAAIDGEPGYWLPHYNLGTLLYNRYTPDDNLRAIECFRAAKQARASRIRALALAGLTMAYCQNVHRFGKPKEPWAFWADVESKRAHELEPNLAETRFARGWAYQVLGRMDKAIDWYDRVTEVPEDIAKIRQLKSFALTNAGFICLYHLNDEARAETYFRDALCLYANKITHANLGEIYKRRREFEAAKEEFEKAISLDAGYVNGWNEFGMLYVAWARHVADDGQRFGPSDSAGSGISPEALLSEAQACHERAITALVDHEGRAKLHETFGAEYRRYGFEREARQEFEEAEATRPTAISPSDIE
jgi:tetratricopeptide (TPR) repeat protein